MLVVILLLIIANIVWIELLGIPPYNVRRSLSVQELYFTEKLNLFQGLF